MNNIIDMKDPSDWVVMNMIKQHIANLKVNNKQGQNADDIRRNEAALRSFFEDIKERSSNKGRSATAALAA